MFAIGALSVSPEMPNGVQGLLESNPQQVVIQVYGIAVTLLWSGVMTFIILKVIGVMGRDLTLHGEAFAISTDYFLSSPSGHWRDFKRQPPAACRCAGEPPGSRR